MDFLIHKYPGWFVFCFVVLSLGLANGLSNLFSKGKDDDQ